MSRRLPQSWQILPPPSKLHVAPPRLPLPYIHIPTPMPTPTPTPQVAFSKIKEIRTVPRAFGAWGDMVRWGLQCAV